MGQFAISHSVGRELYRRTLCALQRLRPFRPQRFEVHGLHVKRQGQIKPGVQIVRKQTRLTVVRCRYAGIDAQEWWLLFADRIENISSQIGDRSGAKDSDAPPRRRPIPTPTRQRPTRHLDVQLLPSAPFSTAFGPSAQTHHQGHQRIWRYARAAEQKFPLAHASIRLPHDSSQADF